MPEAKAAFDKECFDTGHAVLQSISPTSLQLPSDPIEDAVIAVPFASLLTQTEELGPEDVALSLAILLDQLPRNCYRTSQKDIYSHYDRVSRAVVREIRGRGLDAGERYNNSPPWRIWFYMALMHSESVEDHKAFEEVLMGMKKRAEEGGDAAAVGYIDTVWGFLRKHTAILEQFGRYPHRNKSLGRKSTKKEQEWLEDGGDTFGT